MLEAQTDSRGAMQAPGVNLQRSMQRYLASTGYRAIPVLEGSMVFAVHAASNRGVAVCRGTYDRAALRQLVSEVNSMGLSGYTVLVDGLITYGGHDTKDVEIRVDGQMSFEHISEDIERAKMRDVQASKRQVKSDSANESVIQHSRPRG